MDRCELLDYEWRYHTVEQMEVFSYQLAVIKYRPGNSIFLRSTCELRARLPIDVRLTACNDADRRGGLDSGRE